MTTTTVTTTSTATRLPGQLARALDALGIDRDRRAVTVGDETVCHESPIQLRRELGTVLYRHWHAGTGPRPETRELRRDHAFEDLLREATPHRTSRTTAVVRSAPTDSPLGRHVLFDVGRVRLRIPAGDVPRSLPEIGTRTTLDLPAVRPALSPGFFLVNGSAGGPATEGHVLRVYVHLDEPAAAPAVWHAVLARLESEQATYRAKVLAKAASYPRRDAIVLYLSRESWHVVPGLVDAVRDLPGLGAGHSVLTSAITDGVAYAWEPRDSRIGWDRMSFGQHRTAVIAGAVCAHLFDGADLHLAVSEALIESNADPLAPHRNSDSPDRSATLPEPAASAGTAGGTN